MLVALLFYTTIFALSESAKQFSCILTIPNVFTTATLNNYVSTSKYNSNEYLINNMSTLDHLDDFAENNKTYILVHGFRRTRDDAWIGYVKKSLLSAKNTNIIIMDWKPTPNTYNVWAHKTPIIAQLFVDFLKNVSDHINKPLTDWSHFHIIGHSLGGQISGQVAQILQNEGVRVARVTGLDPAGPCYKDGALASLSAKSAEFVDVIHTDSSSEPGQFGTYARSGNIDFYPYGGGHQPGCASGQSHFAMDFVKAFLTIAAELIVGEPSKDLVYNVLFNRDELMCNHYKAPEYFIMSLLYGDTCKLWAIPESEKDKLDENEDINKLCENLDTCAEMGINADRYKHLSGKYYTNVTSVTKHCDKQIKINILPDL